MKKALVLYSGGLDSRLVVKILQEQNFQVETLSFVLPFGCSCQNKIPLPNTTSKIFDIKKEPLLSEYLEILKNPKFGTGTSINPCKDCKIFMFKKAKEYSKEKKFDLIATGEVLGQRPMSQILSAMKIIDGEIGFEILRPLSAKLLPITSYEKSGIINREKLYDFSGRSRKNQMALAKKFNLEYPSPSGGCFLCEKAQKNKIKKLLQENLINEKTLGLVTVGRHFFIDEVWFVVARSEKESIIISSFENSISGDIGKPSVYFSKKSGKPNAIKLQNAYSTGDNLEKRAKFDENKI